MAAEDYLAGFGQSLSGAGGGQAVEIPRPLGGVAQRPGVMPSIRQAERGAQPVALPGTSGSGRPGMYPVSGVGAFGEGYTEEDVQLILRGMPPEKIAQMQRQMQAGGMLPANFRPSGFVDGATRGAFTELLTMANTRSSSYESILAGLARGETNATELRKETAKKFAELNMRTRTDVYQASNPANLRQTVEAAFQQALGRKPTKEEAEPFINTFLSTERGNQSKMFAAQDVEDAEERQRQMGLAMLEADPLGSTGGGVGGIDAFMNAMSAQESGGNYNARNGRTGASGRFQIMPSNWGPWSKEAGLGANAARTPENQDKVARFKMEQYHKQFGSWDAVAVAWYAGPGAVKGYLENPRASRYTRKQGKGNEPSINEYVSSVMGRMGSAGGPQKASAGGGSEADVLWDKLQQMIADAPGKITPGKRTRSYEEQVALYEKYKSGKGPLAAKPGTSKHSDGRANDLKYENQATKRWALENAHRYGLAFPLLNHGEDWHIELADGHYKGDGHAHGGAPPLSRSINTQAQDAGAESLEYARNRNPTETRAFDIGGQFNSLLSILQRGVGV